MGISVLSLWPIPLLMLLAVGVGYVCAQIPFYRNLLAEHARGGRVSSLDGLRGFLALGVVWTHAASSYIYRRDPATAWTWPPSRVYVLLGEVPVVLFFMITGYLFWSKAMRGRLTVVRHYVGRACRILPLYWLLAVMTVVVVLVEGGLRLHVTGSQLTGELLRLTFPGELAYGSHINSVPTTQLLTVTWTLWYEMGFYIALPVIAWFATPRRFAGLVMLSAVVYWLDLHHAATSRFGFSHEMWVIFLFGMATAHLAPALAKWLQIGHSGDVIALAALVIVVCAPFAGAYQLPVYAILVAAFVCFAAGSTLFGLLTASVVRFLGTISYSVYLMHLPSLWLIDKLWTAVHPIAQWSPREYWLRTACATVLTVVVSAVTYRYFEDPFLKGIPGRLLGSRPDAGRAAQPAATLTLTKSA